MDNGRQFKNPLTGETRDLSGADYWHARKASTARDFHRASGKKSAFASISLEDSHYERMCGLSDALDKQLRAGELELEDYNYARKSIDARLDKAWKRLCKARGWNDDVVDDCPDTDTRHVIICDNSVISALTDGNCIKAAYLHGVGICRSVLRSITTVRKLTHQIITEGLI